jgi:hypothetical protein
MQLQQLEQHVPHDRVLTSSVPMVTDTERCNDAEHDKPGSQMYNISEPTLSNGNATTIVTGANGGSEESALYLVGSRRTSPGLPGLFATLLLEREREQLRLGPVS